MTSGVHQTDRFVGAAHTRTWLGVPAWTWAGALGLALLVMGPALGGGALLNLDLVIVDDPPVPPGMWGLGPEIPRRVPLWGPIAWLSALVGGELVGKALLVATLVVAAAGMYRLAARVGAPSIAAAGAGLLYGFGPFLLTRLAVGQLATGWAMAVLPWAVPHLLEPSRSARRVLWWSAAMGVAGVYGGVVCGLFVAAGLLAERRRRPVAVGVAFLVGQLPWLVPLAVVGATSPGVSMAGASLFRPPLDGAGDVGRLLAGLGFWNPLFQVGRDQSVLAAVCGAVLLALAIVGTARLPARWRRPLTAVGGLSFVLAAASAVPGVRRLADAAVDTPLGAPFRETQRFLLPYLLWSCLAAALGAVALAGRLRSQGPTVAMVPFAIGLALVGPGLWGFGGQLRPVVFPPEWHEARRVVTAEPGPVLALPFYEYFTLDIAHDRLVLDVVPFYLGGDVIASSDPRIGPERLQENPDPREPFAVDVVAEAREGAEVADRLVELGIRWVVLQHEVDWELYTGIPTDDGLERVVTGNSLDLYRVRRWPGAVVGTGGEQVDSESIVAPVRRLDASGPAVVAAPHQRGWLRGWSGAGRGPNGQLAVGAGSGMLWYWPTGVVIAADLITLGALVASRRPHRRPQERRQRGRILDDGAVDQ